MRVAGRAEAAAAVEAVAAVAGTLEATAAGSPDFLDYLVEMILLWRKTSS